MDIGLSPRTKLKITSCFLAGPAELMEIPVTGMKKNGEQGGIVEEGIILTPPHTYMW